MAIFIPQKFPNAGIKIFIFCCMIFWLVAVFLLHLFQPIPIFRWINAQHSTELDQLFSIITRIGEFPFILVSTLLLIIVVPKYRQTKFLFVTAIFCNGIPALINLALKNLYKEPRPQFFFKETEWLHLLPNQPEQYHLSFPSGHTEGAFAAATFMALILPQKNKWLAVPLFIIALSTGYSRIYLAQHFFQDILAGSMIGTIFCLLTYVTIQKWWEKAPPQSW